MDIFTSCFWPRNSNKSQDAGWRLFSLKELQNASNNFNYDNKLGEGAFGSVYWGQLWDGSQIAVKRLKVWNSKPEIDFAVEVEILGRVRHKNLLSLRGYCAEGKERLLVYNYMPNLSLSAHLHGHLVSETHLDWDRRMRIAIGCAEALAYLQHYATPHTIHGNLKSNNVLLDADFQPQVADFGFSKLLPDSSLLKATTAAYLPPEYDTQGKASDKCDVYGFGVLLLELVSGRRPQKQGGWNIIDWANPIIYQGKLDDVADQKLRGNFNEVELQQLLQVAQWCIQSSPENRPSMVKVVELLKKVKEVDIE